MSYVGSNTLDWEVSTRSSWGKGPWDDEPDSVVFHAYSFPVVIVRHVTGHWIGFVGVEPWHPWYGLNAPDIRDKGLPSDMGVHGNICFASERIFNNRVRGMPEPEGDRPFWWVGFHTGWAQHGDYAPSWRDNQPSLSYRNIDFAVTEAQKLAHMASAVAAAAKESAKEEIRKWLQEEDNG